MADGLQPEAIEYMLRGGQAATVAKVERLVATQDFPHVLLHGPPGSGKEALLQHMIRKTFGVEALKYKVETKPWKLKLPSGTKVEVDLTTVSSAYHLEMNPSDVGRRDTMIVQEVMKEMAQQGASRPGAAGSRLSHLLVLHEVDKMTKEAQHALRCTMEKNQQGCRLVLLTSCRSKVIDPLISRCLCVRVPAPSAAEVAGALRDFNAEYQMSDELVEKIAANYRSFRTAFLMADAFKARRAALTQGDFDSVLGWKKNIQEAVSQMLRDQSPKSLYEIRQLLYASLVHCIAPETIFIEIMRALFAKVDDHLNYTVATWGAHFENRLSSSSKAIFHLEAFVARFMAVYKEWSMAFFS